MTLVYYRFPVDGIVDGHNFGVEYTSANGTRYKHRGNDWGPVPVGTIERWCGTRPATAVGFTNDGSFGPFAKCLLSEGLYTLYAHSSRNDTGMGDTIQPGQVIGLSGNLGTSTGPHLHSQTCDNPYFPTDISYSHDFYDYYKPGTLPEGEPMTADELKRMERLEALMGANGVFPEMVRFENGVAYDAAGMPITLLQFEEAMKWMAGKGFSMHLGLALHALRIESLEANP